MYQDESRIARAIKVVGILTFISGFILGIVFGNTFQRVVEVGRTIEFAFNWGLMFGVWASSVVSGLMFIGFAKIISLLQIIANNTTPAPAMRTRND